MPNFCALSNLLPASSPANTKLVLAETEDEHLPPLSSISFCASALFNVGSVPVSTNIIPSKEAAPLSEAEAPALGDGVNKPDEPIYTVENGAWDYSPETAVVSGYNLMRYAQTHDLLPVSDWSPLIQMLLFIDNGAVKPDHCQLGCMGTDVHCQEMVQLRIYG